MLCLLVYELIHSSVSWRNIWINFELFYIRLSDVMSFGFLLRSCVQSACITNPQINVVLYDENETSSTTVLIDRQHACCIDHEVFHLQKHFMLTFRASLWSHDRAWYKILKVNTPSTVVMMHARTEKSVTILIKNYYWGNTISHKNGLA